MVDSKIINSNIVDVTSDTPISEVVELMIERNISSVLVTDRNSQVVGIVTERDIVQKFTLLSMQDKLTRLVNTIMSRPVLFCRLNHLKEDVIKLHTEHQLRHFPVIRQSGNNLKDVVGVISMTDLARAAFTLKSISRQAEPAMAKKERALAIFAANSFIAKPYQTFFEQLGYSVELVAELSSFMQSNPQGKIPLLFDMDQIPVPRLSELISSAIKYPGMLLLATTHENLVRPFRERLRGDHHHIFMKPLDFSYCDWLLASRAS